MKFSEKVLIALVVVLLSTTSWLYFEPDKINDSKLSSSSENPEVKITQPRSEDFDFKYQKALVEIQTKNTRLLKRVAELESQLRQLQEARLTAKNKNNLQESSEEQGTQEAAPQADFNTAKEQQVGNYDHYVGKSRAYSSSVSLLVLGGQ